MMSGQSAGTNPSKCLSRGCSQRQVLAVQHWIYRELDVAVRPDLADMQLDQPVAELLQHEHR